MLVAVKYFYFPEELELYCPECKLRHIDEIDPTTGIDWAARPHRKHLCAGCNHMWKPFEHYTVGV